MRRSEGKAKSVRKPFRDISNRPIESSKSTKKLKPGFAKDDRIGSGDVIDRLLLVHSDISNIFRQIDELVVQEVKAEENDKHSTEEIESFTCILSDMLCSLKPWLCNLQKAVSVPKKPTKIKCSGNNLQSPEPSQMENLVSPSPLVSWRATDCTVEMGKQLFALTPLPRQKTAFSNVQSLSKALALPRFNSGAAVFPSCFGKTESSANVTNGSLFKKQTSEASPAHVAKKMKTDNIMRTPSLKLSPIRSCKLMEPNSGYSTRNFDEVHKSTPFPAGKLTELLGDDDESSGHEASQSIGLKYSSSVINPMYSLGKEEQEPYASPTWFMSSPPKTCVLMEPSEDNEPLMDKPWKDDGSESLSGVFKQKMSLASCRSRLPVVESTPMWREPQSTAYKGRRPGENTLKRELWVRFEAATTDGGGLNLNMSFPRESDHKGFLDMLEEAS